MEFDWANLGDECSLGKAVMYRWAQLSNEQMSVEVKLYGENKNVANIPDVTEEDIKEYGDISVVTDGLCLMGSPIGSDEYRSKKVIEFAKTKFKDILRFVERCTDEADSLQNQCAMWRGNEIQTPDAYSAKRNLGDDWRIWEIGTTDYGAYSFE